LAVDVISQPRAFKSASSATKADAEPLIIKMVFATSGACPAGGAAGDVGGAAGAGGLAGTSMAIFSEKRARNSIDAATLNL
jgi:hypothetical protein